MPQQLVDTVLARHVLEDRHDSLFIRLRHVQRLQALHERVIGLDVLVVLLVRRRRDRAHTPSTGFGQQRLERLDRGRGVHHQLVELVLEQDQLDILPLTEEDRLFVERTHSRGQLIAVGQVLEHVGRDHLDVDPVGVTLHRPLNERGLTRTGLRDEDDVRQLRAPHLAHDRIHEILTADDGALRNTHRARVGRQRRILMRIEVDLPRRRTRLRTRRTDFGLIARSHGSSSPAQIAHAHAEASLASIPSRKRARNFVPSISQATAATPREELIADRDLAQ